MFQFSVFQPVRATCLLLVITSVGCGSSNPVTADAAVEQAIREDMSKVASEEQVQRRQSTGMTSASAPAGPNFHPEESGQR